MHKNTEARNKDRHKPGYIRPSRRTADSPDSPRPVGRPRTKPIAPPKPPKEKKPKKEPGWKGKFIAVDGEGWNGRYTLLACSAVEYDLYNPRGLSTKACLEYLSGWSIKPGDAMVGFGLSYDFENILRDIPEADYIKLLNNQEITYKNFILKNYIPRKFLEVQRVLDSVNEKGENKKKTIFLQCTLGFFQTSFIKALEKFNIPIPPIIEEGKALRGEFHPKDLEFIKRYNRTELDLIIKLMNSLRDSGKEAFEVIGLKPNFTPRTWFGPGAWASNFLKQTKWVKEHPAFEGPTFELLQAEMEEYLNINPWDANPEKRDLENTIKEINRNKKMIIRDKQEILSLAEWDLFKEIRAHGGIAPSTSGAWAGEYLESIPRTLKRKNGRPLDQMADELGYTVSSLLDAISNRKTPKTPRQLYQEAEAISYHDPDYKELLALEHKIQKAWALEADLIPDHKALKEIADLKEFPFAAAFFGGRIESAAVGEFRQPLFDYDINSAYPFAAANLPWWRSTDLVRVEGFDPLDRMGMYFVEWDCPPGANFYPFPYRAQTGNVFYPPKGRGWYMAPEVHAALNVWGDCIKVSHGYVLYGTDGAGDGITPLPEDKLCTTAQYIIKMAKIRMKAKASHLSYEKALKLVLNSIYGKLIQQVGSHKFLNPFAASWITSTCRAIIARTIGRDEDDSIISIMTDGILSRKELPVTIGENLGQFELKTFDNAIQFMPGVYYLGDTKNPKRNEYKYRGMDKEFDPQKAKEILWEDYWEEAVKVDGKTQTIKHGTYKATLNCFVTRNLSIHQPDRFKEHVFKFVPVEKEEEFTLRSKRAPGPKGYRMYKKENNRFFAPKGVNPMELMLGRGSKPYTLDLPSEVDYGEATTPEELLSEESLNSLIETDIYDLKGGFN